MPFSASFKLTFVSAVQQTDLANHVYFLVFVILVGLGEVLSFSLQLMLFEKVSSKYTGWEDFQAVATASFSLVVLFKVICHD